MEENRDLNEEIIDETEGTAESAEEVTEEVNEAENNEENDLALVKKLKEENDGQIPSDIIDMLYTNHKLNAISIPYGTCM